MSNVKVGLIERWNKLAKKSIYINESFEIGVGRLVFSAIVIACEAIPILIMTGNWAAACVTLGGFLMSLKQKKE